MFGLPLSCHNKPALLEHAFNCHILLPSLDFFSASPNNASVLSYYLEIIFKIFHWCVFSQCSFVRFRPFFPFSVTYCGEKQALGLRRGDNVTVNSSEIEFWEASVKQNLGLPHRDKRSVQVWRQNANDLFTLTFIHIVWILFENGRS